MNTPTFAADDQVEVSLAYCMVARARVAVDEIAGRQGRVIRPSGDGRDYLVEFADGSWWWVFAARLIPMGAAS